jgi:hypothetical protein
MFGFFSLLIALICFILYWFGSGFSAHDLLGAGLTFFVLGHMLDVGVAFVRGRRSE